MKNIKKLLALSALALPMVSSMAADSSSSADAGGEAKFFIGAHVGYGSGYANNTTFKGADNDPFVSSTAFNAGGGSIAGDVLTDVSWPTAGVANVLVDYDNISPAFSRGNFVGGISLGVMCGSDLYTAAKVVINFKGEQKTLWNIPTNQSYNTNIIGIDATDAATGAAEPEAASIAPFTQNRASNQQANFTSRFGIDVVVGGGVHLNKLSLGGYAGYAFNNGKFHIPYAPIAADAGPINYSQADQSASFHGFVLGLETEIELYDNVSFTVEFKQRFFLSRTVELKSLVGQPNFFTNVTQVTAGTIGDHNVTSTQGAAEVLGGNLSGTPSIKTDLYESEFAVGMRFAM